MQRAVIKRVGDKRVDVQPQGSTSTLTNVSVSAQVSWELLEPGVWVLLDTVNEQPIVLHTLRDIPLFYGAKEQTYTAVLDGALLADGSIPLTGDLAVAPGVTMDGYDISVLGEAIDNLQAADGVSRTGFTVLTHASHLVENIGEDDTQILIRHSYFVDTEQLLVSNANGEIEFMRVVGEPAATVDNDGALCYRYTVVRRVATNPAGIVTGWAAATVVNGLTLKGYIAFDARHNRPTTPAMRFVLFTDPDAGTTEQIVRMGALANILGFGADKYGFAVGKLTTGDRYISYCFNDDLLALRGADISILDTNGEQAFRVWATHDGAHVPGDALLGRETGGHIETFENEVYFYAGSDPSIVLSPAGSRFRNMVWAGTQPGPQIGIGEKDGEAHIVARNRLGSEQFHVRTGTNEVHVHIGNPKPYEHWMEFDEQLIVDGTIRARDGAILGVLDMGENGEIRFGTGTPGVDFTGLRMGAINDGDGVYQLAGYDNDEKQTYFGPDGRIYWAGGSASADADGIRHIYGANASWKVEPDGLAISEIVATGWPLGIGLNVIAAGGIGVASQATSGTAVSGEAGDGVGVKGVATQAGGIGVKAMGSSGITALAIEGGMVDGGNQRYTNLANATASTDALPKGQADGLYAPLAHARYIWLTASDPATGIVATRRLIMAGGLGMDTGADNIGWIALRAGSVTKASLRFKVTAYDTEIASTVTLKIYKNGTLLASSTAWDVNATGWHTISWTGSAAFSANDNLQVEIALSGAVTVEKPHATVELLLSAI